MAGINKVILVGNLGRDPEVRTLEGGAKVARFTLATSEVYKDRATGEKKENTEWHTVVCWRNLADIAEKYLSKGRQVDFEGRLRTRSWDDNGVKRYSTEVVADTFQMLGKSDTVPDAAANQAPFAAPDPARVSFPEESPNLPPEENDLPF